ncbi:hypothetical protein Tsp_03221 [Trichinella spiralis]|uniref:hypothetical protein n=1 Tax=Trichinella spiralis TaxID=6334 RepID=UPI0001EFC1B0|nr:hypothetical protein Tsp_03221 [Trichinella spiralis]
MDRFKHRMQAMKCSSNTHVHLSMLQLSLYVIDNQLISHCSYLQRFAKTLTNEARNYSGEAWFVIVIHNPIAIQTSAIEDVIKKSIITVESLIDYVKNANNECDNKN